MTSSAVSGSLLRRVIRNGFGPWSMIPVLPLQSLWEGVVEERPGLPGSPGRIRRLQKPEAVYTFQTMPARTGAWATMKTDCGGADGISEVSQWTLLIRIVPTS